jgi:hypothetical protein
MKEEGSFSSKAHRSEIQRRDGPLCQSWRGGGEADDDTHHPTTAQTCGGTGGPTRAQVQVGVRMGEGGEEARRRGALCGERDGRGRAGAGGGDSIPKREGAVWVGDRCSGADSRQRYRRWHPSTSRGNGADRTAARHLIPGGGMGILVRSGMIATLPPQPFPTHASSWGRAAHGRDKGAILLKPLQRNPLA